MTDPQFWLVDGVEEVRALSVDPLNWRCTPEWCRRELELVVSFADRSRVRVDVQVELFVNYDSPGAAPPAFLTLEAR